MYAHMSYIYLIGFFGFVVIVCAISHKKQHYPDSRAQDHEDIYAMKHFFKDRETGVILESGALDGMRYSTSFMFEKRYGWKAIHIEAAPDSFAALVRNRPESININAALCANTSYVHYIYASSRQAKAVSGIVEFMSPTFLAYWWPIGSSGKRVDENGFPAQITEIKCDRLGNILKNINVAHVDFWVLDVEGAELAVLETVDFTRISFDVICVELDGGNMVKDDAVVALLRANGYGLYSKETGRNTWFVNTKFMN